MRLKLGSEDTEDPKTRTEQATNLRCSRKQEAKYEKKYNIGRC